MESEEILNNFVKIMLLEAHELTAQQLENETIQKLIKSISECNTLIYFHTLLFHGPMIFYWFEFQIRLIDWLILTVW